MVTFNSKPELLNSSAAICQVKVFNDGKMAGCPVKSAN